MIRVTSIKRCKVSEYDEVYLIVRSIECLKRSKSSILSHATQVDDLSPSKNLFFAYLNWQKTGSWNISTFENEYKTRFLDELKANKNAITWLEVLKSKDAAGKKIAVICFCDDENLCHRKIIGEILRDNSCNVIFDKDTKRGVI